MARRGKQCGGTGTLGRSAGLLLIVTSATAGGCDVADGSRASLAPPTAPVPASALQALRWRSIGPFRGGRAVAVAGLPSERLVFYQGSTGGGVWKTEDGGHRWTNVSDGFFGTGSVGAIAVAESDPDVVYVGTGETCLRGNISHGDGVYRSGDGGRTWAHVGLEDTRHIGRIRIHPRDPDRAYVAALGHAWGPNSERGVYRTRDGGATWERVLFVDEETGAVDLVLDPANADVLYATTWQARRYPWGQRMAGPGSGIYKSTDGGDSWTDITRNAGLPHGADRGRIGIALSPARPDRLWVVLDAEGDQNGVYRSDDAGATWSRVSDRWELTERPFYYNHIIADPVDPETVYVLATRFWKSTDGGRTYTSIPTPHGDNHDLWIDPGDPLRMVEANDGGATVTFDGGKSWSTLQNQPTAQFYHVTTDTRFPYRVYGNQQDAGTIALPSRSDLGSITAQEWYGVGGHEDGYTAVKPDDPHIVYSGDHHWLTRYDERTQQVKFISPWNEIFWGWGARDLKYRFQWVFPIVVSPHDPGTLYVTSQFVHRSATEGDSWELISPDLTRADTTTLERTTSWGESEETGPYWGPLRRENTGIEWYATIFAFAESHVQPGVLWAGSDDGLIHVSQNGGEGWDDVTPPDLPEFTLVSVIEPSPQEPAVAYVAATRYKLDDPAPYLFRTRDYGESWTRIVEGLRPGDFTRVIRADPERAGLLYAGTETGVYVSWDDGDHWQPLQLNLPVTPIHDIQVKDKDLVVATHGRSFWILDDLTVLHQLTEDVLSSPFHLFRPRTTVRFREGSSGPVAGRTQSPPEATAPNPPNGVWIHYVLGSAAEASDSVVITIREAEGAVIRRFSSTETKEPEVPTQPGLNRFVWDLRYPGPEELPGAVFRRYAPRGPLAPPGTYEVVLTIGGESRTERFQIVKDPRLEMTDREFREQHELLLRIRSEITRAHETAIRIRATRAELEQKMHGSGSESDAAQRAAAARDELYRIEEQLAQIRARDYFGTIRYPVRLNDKLSTLAGLVEMADSPPTAQDHELLEDLSSRLDEQIATFESFLETEWSALQLALGSRQ